MSIFRKRSSRQPETLDLAGFADSMAFERRQPIWEPDQQWPTIEAATDAARAWLASRGSDAIVEVQRTQGSNAVVVRVISATGVEDIEP